MTFTDDEFSTILNALRVARDRFVEDAAAMRQQQDNDAGAFERLAKQFDKQAAETAVLADRIADKEGL